jgi:hypothetical protein
VIKIIGYFNYLFILSTYFRHLLSHSIRKDWFLRVQTFKFMATYLDYLLTKTISWIYKQLNRKSIVYIELR